MNDLQDITYDVDDGLAWIVINRPDRYNAFRGRTIDELIRAFKAAWADPAVGVVALTGAGEKAFCTGGDQKQRGETGDYGPTETGLFEVEALHRLVRDIPKPVIAAVNGYAIGGGHVLHVTCDITIAADHAKFGQTGPKVGSFDAGLRVGLPRAHHRSEASPRNLDVLPPVRCGHGRTMGPRQRCRPDGRAPLHGSRLG